MESPEKLNTSKLRLLRCRDWLQKQNSENSDQISQKNNNEVEYIITSNTERENLPSEPEDESIPAGIDESSVKPKAVPLNRLRVEGLHLECEWQSCRMYSTNYELFQKHVRTHTSDLHKMDKGGTVEFVCLWDICGHKTSDYPEMVRHVNYHAYHSRLLAIGFNGRATLKLERCKKDSSKRNQLPEVTHEHWCMWIDCDNKFSSIQTFFDHVNQHVKYADKLVCSWAGCGMTFARRVLLTGHLRSHTGERQIACYHCGQHFTCNRKLCDHLRRQNVNPSSAYSCPLCGVKFATEYLLREHARQHVSAYACALCDMSATTPAALAQHVRYRHLPAQHRTHRCPHCPYRAVNQYDLRKHIPTHTRKRKKDNKDEETDDCSDEENTVVKKPRVAKKYACHMCSGDKIKVFSRGTILTTHLAKVHGAHWPSGHSRFRYQISEDGMYRLTTTRYEVLEVSKQIVDGYSDPKESLKNSFEFDVRQVAEASKTSPRKYEIRLKGADAPVKPDIPVEPKDPVNPESSVEPDSSATSAVAPVEITMCDVDDQGNIISSKVIESDVVYGS
ncbi:hypothetical protein ACJJTC_017984 [Scirpophaga incertulas]